MNFEDLGTEMDILKTGRMNENNLSQ